MRWMIWDDYGIECSLSTLSRTLNKFNWTKKGQLTSTIAIVELQL